MSDGISKVGEDKKFNYFRSEMCVLYEKHLSKYDSDGFTFGRLQVYLLEDKTTGERTYVGYDLQGNPVIDFKDGYDLDFKIKVAALEMSESCDIVNMAEKKQGKKV